LSNHISLWKREKQRKRDIKGDCYSHFIPFHIQQVTENSLFLLAYHLLVLLNDVTGNTAHFYRMLITSILKIWFYVLIVLHQTVGLAGKFIMIFTFLMFNLFDKYKKRNIIESKDADIIVFQLKARIYRTFESCTKKELKVVQWIFIFLNNTSKENLTESDKLIGLTLLVLSDKPESIVVEICLS
jgi:hypothetical protein